MSGGEKKFELKVRRFLEENGVYECGTPIQDMNVEPKGWYFKMWGGGYSKSGIPDLICNVNGFFFGIEVKDTKGRLDELQKRNLIMINNGGGVGLVLYPEGFNEFKQIIHKTINAPNTIFDMVFPLSITKCKMITE